MGTRSKRSNGAESVLRAAVSALRVYLELAKFRLSGMVLLTTAVGFVLAPHGPSAGTTLLWALLGTALSAAGANTLNQLLEIDRDRLMERTRARPLPSGQISRAGALATGLGSIIAGLAVLAAGTNMLTTALSALVIVLYVLVYTPMKLHSSLNTLVGAVCGAIPPMMGWTAASNQIGFGALLLGCILFLWQIPHFFALAWLYRDDYRRAGFRMLPLVDPRGRLSGRIALVHTLALVPLGAGAWAAGFAGQYFLVGSIALSLAFSYCGWELLRWASRAAARRLFLASLVYLPFLLGLMVADRTRPEPGFSERTIVALASSHDAGELTAVPFHRSSRRGPTDR